MIQSLLTTLIVTGASAQLPASPIIDVEIAGTAYHFDPADTSLAPSPDVLQTATESRPAHRPFGLADTRSWLINGGLATDFNDTNAARVGVGISYFVADDVSFDAELNLLYFNQPEDDALGVNLNFMIRWHALRNNARTWSLYFDAGVGLMGSNEDVPDHGSRFSFTPQLGAGMSFQIAGDSRLYVGTRWHHVSNANIFEANPGIDTQLVYAMLGFPF
jgi:hypothetical protein